MTVAVGVGAVEEAMAVAAMAAEEVAGIAVAVGTVAAAGRQGAAGKFWKWVVHVQISHTDVAKLTVQKLDKLTGSFAEGMRSASWHSADLDEVTVAVAVVLVTEAVAAGVAAVVAETDVVCLEPVCTVACCMCSTHLLRVLGSPRLRCECRAWVRGAPGPAEPCAGAA